MLKFAFKNLIPICIDCKSLVDLKVMLKFLLVKLY